MRVAGITARGEPVEILEVDELAPPAADEVLLDVAAGSVVAAVGQRDLTRI
jgi:Zn-dependent alcohol dehydrogenase